MTGYIYKESVCTKQNYFTSLKRGKGMKEDKKNPFVSYVDVNLLLRNKKYRTKLNRFGKIS